MSHPKYYALVSSQLLAYWSPDLLLCDILVNKERFKETCDIFRHNTDNQLRLCYDCIDIDDLRSDVNEYNSKLREAEATLNKDKRD